MEDSEDFHYYFADGMEMDALAATEESLRGRS